MKIKEIVESATAGATGAGSIASVPVTGGGSKVGTLFGGSYQQKRPGKKATKKPSESIIKR